MRFGLFGTGPWAHLAHAPALAGHSGVDLIGVWGRNPDRAAELAGQYGARPYAGIDELIADVDAVAIALPPDVQAPLALAAARAGCHLLLDKPVAFTATTSARSSRRATRSAARPGAARAAACGTWGRTRSRWSCRCSARSSRWPGWPARGT
jgi:predicted dehydrogenase